MTIEEAHQRLRRAGWSIGSTAFRGRAGGLSWLVSGVNGENVIRATGATEADAWESALSQARALGMLDNLSPGAPGPG